jgi:hypothetical protein
MNTIIQAADNAHPVLNWIGIVGTALASVAGILPPIAALVSIVWGCLQIYSWLEKRRKK